VCVNVCMYIYLLMCLCYCAGYDHEPRYCSARVCMRVCVCGRESVCTGVCGERRRGSEFVCVFICVSVDYRIFMCFCHCILAHSMLELCPSAQS